MGVPDVVARTSLAVMLVTLASYCVSASATTLRCSRGVVTLGDDETAVLARCGEPSSRSYRERKIETVNHIGIRVTRVVEVESWVYERGSGRFVQILEFSGGELVSIRRGPRAP